MRRLRRRVTRSRSNRETASRRVAPAQIHPPKIDRKALLLGTALASTLLISAVMAPMPAHATFNCLVGPPPAPASPGPISDTFIDDSIVCINTEARTNAAGNAIELSTINPDHSIYLNNSGILTATNAPAFGHVRSMSAVRRPS